MNTLTSSTPSCWSWSSAAGGLANSWDCASKIVSSCWVLGGVALAGALLLPPHPSINTATAATRTAPPTTASASVLRENRVKLDAKVRVQGFGRSAAKVSRPRTISAGSGSRMRADACPGPLGLRSRGPDLQGAEGSKQSGRGVASRRPGGDRGVAPVRHAGLPELLVRRGAGCSRAPPVVRLNALVDGWPRDQSAAVLRARLGVGAGVRDWGNRAPLAVGAGRNGGDPDRLPVRSRARLTPRRPRRGGSHRAQPVHDLVLAGGAGVHAARGHVRMLAAVLRPGLARTVGPERRAVGVVLFARGA